MRVFCVLWLALVSLCAYAAESGFEQLRNSYERFFTARYALEQDFPFRLISVRDRLVPITPNTDVMQPLMALRAADFVAREKVNALLTKSFLPLLYSITTAERGDALILIRQFVTSALQQLGDVSRQQLRHLVQKIPARKLAYTLFLAPYRQTDADLYYGRQKISMVRNGTVSLRSEDSRDAQRHISKEIDLYRALIFYRHDKKQRVPTLLAARLHLELNERAAALRTDILFNLFPRTMPFVREEPPVAFRNFVVPSGDKFRFPTALLSVYAPLGGKQHPRLDITFGNFVSVKGMEFISDDQHHYAPYLAGRIQKFSPLQVKLRVQKISVSLLTLRAEKVHSAFSLGFQLGSLRSADFGNFKIAKVDQKLKASINREIDAAQGKLLNNVLTSDSASKFVSDNTLKAVQQLFSPTPAEGSSL